MSGLRSADWARRLGPTDPARGGPRARAGGFVPAEPQDPALRRVPASGAGDGGGGDCRTGAGTGGVLRGASEPGLSFLRAFS